MKKILMLIIILVCVQIKPVFAELGRADLEKIVLKFSNCMRSDPTAESCKHFLASPKQMQQANIIYDHLKEVVKYFVDYPQMNFDQKIISEYLAKDRFLHNVRATTLVKYKKYYWAFQILEYPGGVGIVGIDFTDVVPANNSEIDKNVKYQTN